MSLQMRTLKGTDLFKVLKILSKLGVKDIVLQAFGKSDLPKVKDAKDVAQLTEGKGFNIIAVIVEALTDKLPNVETELNEFLALLTESDVEVIEELEFNEYIQLVMDFFKKEELTSFFQQLSSFTSTMN